MLALVRELIKMYEELIDFGHYEIEIVAQLDYILRTDRSSKNKRYTPLYSLFLFKVKGDRLTDQ